MYTLCAFSDEADPSLQGQIAALRDNGISYMEIRGIDGKNIADISVAESKEIKKQLDDSGLTVWSIGSPSGKIQIDDPFVPHLDSFKHMLELAHILEASHYRLFSFYGTDGRLDRENAVLERLSAFLKAAKGSGICLCHENEKGIYGDIAGRCVRIHEALPELKAIFDPANFIQCNQNSYEAFLLLKPYIEYIHIKDALPNGTIAPAGHGEGAIPQILAETAGRNYMLTIEPHLHVFDGLKALEEDGNTSHVGAYAYETPRKAFDEAVKALTGVLADIGQ